MAGVFLAAGALAGGLHARAFPDPDIMDDIVDPAGVVLAVEAYFAADRRDEDGAEAGMVRVNAYADEATFLSEPTLKAQSAVGENGIAVVKFGALPPGDYAFVAYFDANGDQQLNRGRLGRPKEPYAFSNGVRGRLRRPKFKETAVPVGDGAIVVITLSD